MQEATTNFATNYDMQISYLHDIKATVAPGLAIVVREIAESGHNPEHTLEDILKIARLLDISAPAPRKTANTLTDPRYNLLDFIKHNSGSRTIRDMNANELLFKKHIPFTCNSQIEEMLDDVSQKINRNYIEGSNAN